MVKIIEAKVKGRGVRVAIVVSRFNKFITEKLLNGCVNELVRCGVRKGDIVVAWTPGAFEVPLVAKRFARKKTVDVVIALGAVIRGETYHFEMVAQGATQGIMQVSLDTMKPVIFGVLTTETLDQAYKRSEEDGDNKGKDAAQAAIEMACLLEKI
ncbi:MAG: 6,7-dimethyl-8-ribityllumazine synthase [Candidatus Omnitrophica bacterium]|nr:6,7-dimethyl-8-ribityllumazine synthase [Candidatus Omnitrophota bacterium]